MKENWYHVGHPVTTEHVLDRVARGLPVYQPTDPRSMDQTEYIRFAAKIDRYGHTAEDHEAAGACVRPVS